MANISKADLVDKVAEATGLNKSQSKDALDAVLGTITTHLEQGDRVTLTVLARLKFVNAVRERVSSRVPARKFRFPPLSILRSRRARRSRKALSKGSSFV